MSVAILAVVFSDQYSSAGAESDLLQEAPITQQLKSKNGFWKKSTYFNVFANMNSDTPHRKWSRKDVSFLRVACAAC